MEKDELSITFTCDPKAKGGLPAFTEQGVTGWNQSDRFSLVSKSIYVQGRGIGRHSDDDLFEPLPGDHPGRAWGAKTWGDLYPWYRAQPRYEVDITLSVDPQQNPPIMFVTGNGVAGQAQTAVVQRRFNTTQDNQRISLRRYCELGSSETVTFTVKAVITGRRPIPQ